MRRKVKDNSGLLKDLFEILEDNSIHSSSDLADELNCPKNKVRSLIQIYRKKFNNGDADIWIYSTRGGYTIDDAPEHAVYEGRMRLAMGLGVLINGAFVLKQMKKIAQKEFGNLIIEYQPKMLEMGKIIK